MGRGSFTEPVPLLGLDLAQYDELFEEKLNLFVELTREQEVTWSGSTRPPSGASESSPPLSPVPSTPGLELAGARVSGASSSIRPPLVLAIIGGDPRRVGPYVHLYRQALAEFGHGALPIAVHSTGYVGESDDQAREELWRYYKEGRD